MGEWLYPFYWVINLMLDLFKYVVITGVILSWLFAFEVISIRNPLVRAVDDICHRITDPFYRPLRRFLPPIGGLDLSPLVLLVAVFFVQYYLGLAFRSLL